jgi:hypothetical protein
MSQGKGCYAQRWYDHAYHVWLLALQSTSRKCIARLAIGSDIDAVIWVIALALYIRNFDEVNSQRFTAMGQSASTPTCTATSQQRWESDGTCYLHPYGCGSNHDSPAINGLSFQGFAILSKAMGCSNYFKLNHLRPSYCTVTMLATKYPECATILLFSHPNIFQPCPVI